MSGVRRCAEACRARGAPVPPELVDLAEDGRALLACQPLAHWNRQLLGVLSRPPSFLGRVLEAKILSARGLLEMEADRTLAAGTDEVLGDELQADG